MKNTIELQAAEKCFHSFLELRNENHSFVSFVLESLSCQKVLLFRWNTAY